MGLFCSATIVALDMLGYACCAYGPGAAAAAAAASAGRSCNPSRWQAVPRSLELLLNSCLWQLYCTLSLMYSADAVPAAATTAGILLSKRQLAALHGLHSCSIACVSCSALDTLWHHT